MTLLLGAQRFARSNVQLYEEVLAYNEQMGGNQVCTMYEIFMLQGNRVWNFFSLGL